MNSRKATSWMWAEALAMLDQADRLHRQFFRVGRGARDVLPAAPNWEAPVDVVETPAALLLTLALPGVSADSITIAIEPDAVAVSALRPFPANGADVRIHRMEIPYGRFERRVALPMHALELVEKSYQDGCLRLLLVKRSRRERAAEESAPKETL